MRVSQVGEQALRKIQTILANADAQKQCVQCQLYKPNRAFYQRRLRHISQSATCCIACNKKPRVDQH